MGQDDELGGDPACWSHLFDDPERVAEVIDLPVIAGSAEGRGPLWSLASTDLNANLIRLGPDDAIAEHVNAECDVIVIGVTGSGIVVIDALGHPVQPGSLVLIPKDAARAITPTDAPFAYLTIHKRRSPLVPKRPSPTRGRGDGGEGISHPDNIDETDQP